MKKNIFETINKYLNKHNHEPIMSLYLNGYNGNNIYIRFDYIKNLSVYKVSWFDLNFINEKKLDEYINVQMVTGILATRLVECINNIKVESDNAIDENILDDIVEISFFNNKDFVFSRFLPLKWSFLVDIIVILFSYLPRSMDVILTEIFAIYDKKENYYNMIKPIKYDLFNDDINRLFPKSITSNLDTIKNEENIAFLEHIGNKYFALIEDNIPHIIVISEVKPGYVILQCDCMNKNYCKHLYVTLDAIKNKITKNFYKVKRLKEDNVQLLEKIFDTSFNICIGCDYEDNLLLISEDGHVIKEPIMINGKVSFEVVEDDTEYSLSKKIEEVKNK